MLLAVGPRRAADVLAHFAEEEVEQITLELATLGDVPADQLDDVLGELRAEALAHERILSGSEDQARQLLRRLLGDRDADEVLERLLASVHQAPFVDLRERDPDEVVQQLRDEPPQAIALILSHLPAQTGAQVLTRLDTSTQTDVAYRLATCAEAGPDVVSTVDHMVRERLNRAGPQRHHPDGVKELAALLNHADRDTERTLLAKIEMSDPDLAEQVRALMFLFEDLATLDDRSLQELLRNADIQQLAVALKGTSDDLKAAINRNLSPRARTALTEEIDLLGPVPRRDVERAQTEIVQLARHLEAEGTIDLHREPGNYIE